MFRNRFALAGFALVLALALAAPVLPSPSARVLAQGPEVIAEGLDNPRGLFYAADGTLYIAEAGSGGNVRGYGPFNSPVQIGLTGRISAVSPDGTRAVVVTGLTSMNNGGWIYGAMAVAEVDGTLWLALGEGPVRAPFTMGLLSLDAATGRSTRFVDLYTPEAEMNPDGDIIASQPADLAFGPDGAIYIANAGCNCVMRYTDADGVSIFASWTIDDNPVPTTVELGPDGDLYVGFLSGFPFAEGSSRVERWTLDGELVATYPGLTAVVGLLVDDAGTIYAVELGRYGDTGWTPETGRVVVAGEGGPTPLLEGLNTPYGIAQAPDGRLAVSINGSADAGAGQVILIDAAS